MLYVLQIMGVCLYYWEQRCQENFMNQVQPLYFKDEEAETQV